MKIKNILVFGLFSIALMVNIRIANENKNSSELFDLTSLISCAYAQSDWNNVVQDNTFVYTPQIGKTWDAMKSDYDKQIDEWIGGAIDYDSAGMVVETFQAGLSKASQTTSTKVGAKLNASGTWMVVDIGAEGSFEKTITTEYDCCQSGGNNCSSNLRNCS